MVNENLDQVEPSTSDAQVDKETGVGQEQAEGQPEEHNVKVEEEEGVGTIDVEAGPSSQEEVVTTDPFAGLGSVDEIAAAAIQAANIGALFGAPEGEQGEETATTTAEDTTRGVKRSHDDMLMAPEEANVASTSTAAAAIASSDTVPMSSSSTSTIVSSDAPAEASNPEVALPTTSTDDSSSTSIPSTEADELSFEANVPFSIGSLDLQAVAQAAMGLDADGNPLPGNEESHRALAEAVKQLSAAQGITLPNVKNGDELSDQDGNGGPIKRFQCTQCERAFARAYNLNTHLATHDPDPSRSKPFPCPYPSCKTDGGRSFSRKHDLQRHVASTHENEPEPVTSTVGENGVEQTGGLASLGLGTPGRKFRCEECGRAFVRRDALKRHQCTRAMDSPSCSSSAQVEKPPTLASSSSSAPVENPTPDYFSNVAAGFSLYTSNSSSGPLTTEQYQAPSAKTSESVAGSSYDSDPFGPNGITYENLSKEVQDMAMQLVAQAQSYNDQQPPLSTSVTASASSTSATVSAAPTTSSAIIPATSSVTTSSAPAAPTPATVDAQPLPPPVRTQQQVAPIKVEEESKNSAPPPDPSSTAAAVPASTANHNNIIAIKRESSDESPCINYIPSNTSGPTPDPISAQ